MTETRTFWITDWFELDRFVSALRHNRCVCLNSILPHKSIVVRGKEKDLNKLEIDLYK